MRVLTITLFARALCASLCAGVLWRGWRRWRWRWREAARGGPGGRRQQARVRGRGANHGGHHQVHHVPSEGLYARADASDEAPGPRGLHAFACHVQRLQDCGGAAPVGPGAQDQVPAHQGRGCVLPQHQGAVH